MSNRICVYCWSVYEDDSDTHTLLNCVTILHQKISLLQTTLMTRDVQVRSLTNKVHILEETSVKET